MRDIGDKFPALPVAVGQPVPLRGDLARQLDKRITQLRHFIRRARHRRLRCQLFNGADTVLLQPGHFRRQPFYRPRDPVPDQSARQQGKARHQQQRPHYRAPERLVPRHIRQSVKLLALQDNIQIAAQLPVLAQRRYAKHFLFIQAARIVTVHRPAGATEKSLQRRDGDFLPLNMPRRCGVGQQIAIG
ncbi:hypothetical protein D3C81_1340650 [compost metagenome]